MILTLEPATETRLYHLSVCVFFPLPSLPDSITNNFPIALLNVCILTFSLFLMTN